MYYYVVDSKSRQRALICMLFLLIVLSLSNIVSISNTFAFDFGIPDIPFLNFDFDSKESSSNNKDNNLSDNKSDNIIFNPFFDSSNDMNVVDHSLDEESDSFKTNFEANNVIESHDTLPFPANTINSAIYGQTDLDIKDEPSHDDDEKKFDPISSSISGILPPLISDYTDLPSTFLFESKPEVGKEIPNQYIVVLNDDDESALPDLLSIISEKEEFQGVKVLQVFENVLNGIAVKVPNRGVIEEIKGLPMVKYVENDVMVEAFAQTTQTGIDRIDADLSFAALGVDKENVDTDIAVLDTGIDLKHSDLNIYHQKSFVRTSNIDISLFFDTQTDIISTTANDDNGHGTHIAGIAAAMDNSVGTTGVAPGAKLWAIKVLDNNGTGALSTIIKGIDYITQYADQIEVVNLSLGCKCRSSAFDTAINNSVKAGIVFVVAAAGNDGKDAKTTSPAGNPNVISVSALADSDGKCNIKGSETGYGTDDSLEIFSNHGSVIDVAAPGSEIYSSYKGNTFAPMSGTSMASAQVAGAAALYLASNPEASPLAVKTAMLEEGSKFDTNCQGNGFGFLSEGKDNTREPL